MQPLLAMTLFTWAAVYAYVGAFYCVLHARRPTHREYLAFGLTCLALVGWSIGGGLRFAATSVEEASVAVQLQFVGGFASAPLFCEFAALMTKTRAQRILRFAYVVSAIGLVANAAGLVTEGTRAPRPEWGLAIAPERIDVGLRPVGIAFALYTLGLVLWGCGMFLRSWRHKPELRPITVAAVIGGFAGAHDIVVRIANLRSVYLVEHAGLLLVLAVSWVLLRSFVRTADELGKRTDELRQSYSSLRVTQEELVRKEQLAAVGELSAVIAHEVRNPLAIIKNAVSSLRRPTLRASDRGVLLGILDEEVDRLNRLVRDLLAYARPVEPRGRAIHLGRIIEEAVEKARAGHDDPDSVELALELASCPTIHGDPDLLRQAITNIADNAMQAMPGGGRMTVRAARRRLAGEPAVALQFIDTGEGMDTLVRDKALDPFFTTRAAGTGLGLAIVERVVRNHGGALSIESAQGEGTTVHVTLPLERQSSVPPPPEDE